MRKEQFENWLKSQGIDSFSNYVSRLKKVEKYYDAGIDAYYEKDGCASLLAEFEYTTDDKQNKRDKKHKIPIKPKPSGNKFKSYYDGTKDYASRIKKYIEFRESEHDGQLAQAGSFPHSNVLDGTAPATKQPKRNIRYKGNPIGNAQNLVIRTILSNLGDESFSEKEWEETKQHFGNKCAYCGASDKKIIRDHAIPINKYKLGEHRLGNIVPACETCNAKKGDQDYIAFCSENQNENAISKIEEYMKRKNYSPLTADAGKSDSIRIVLHKAHEEIHIVAMKYIELINDLFFNEH